MRLRSTLAAATIAAGLTVGIASMAYASVQDDPLGVYDVPGGRLTVATDGSAYYEPDEDVILGVCGMDDTDAGTGAWHEPVYGCVPMYAPDGFKVTHASADDGSGEYAGSAWWYSAEGRFLPVG